MSSEFPSLLSTPWSNSQLRRLGKAIIAGDDAIPGLSYAEVTEWYITFMGDVANVMHDIDYSGLDTSQHLLSFRVKTVETLRDKLIARHGLQINHVHDIMGFRIVADMTLATQDVLVQRIGDVLPMVEILDLREHPHSGYRAVHVIVKFSNGAYAEVQVRTLLQDLWANCFEQAGDIFGRAIRYDGKPTRDDHGLVEELLKLSEPIYRLEKQWSVLSENGLTVSDVQGLKQDIIVNLRKIGDRLSEYRDKMKI